MAGRYWMVCGAVLAALGVGLGAIGAHVLKERLSAEQLVTYETGVRYHLYHALALIVIGLVIERYAGSLLQASAVAMLLGIVLVFGRNLRLAGHRDQTVCPHRADRRPGADRRLAAAGRRIARSSGSDWRE